jgi:hypothetical protein
MADGEAGALLVRQASRDVMAAIGDRFQKQKRSIMAPYVVEDTDGSTKVTMTAMSVMASLRQQRFQLLEAASAIENRAAANKLNQEAELMRVTIKRDTAGLKAALGKTQREYDMTDLDMSAKEIIGVPLRQMKL